MSEYARRLAAAAGVLLVVAAGAGPAQAQTFQGTLRAVVEDQQGAAIPGVTVTVRNENTGDTRTQVTTNVGTVVFPNLIVGNYSLVAELTGFKKYQRTGIGVKSNQSIDVQARLMVGGLEETITVVGGAELVKVSSSQLEGATFSAQQLIDLPVFDPTLLGDVTNFSVMAAGVGTQSGGVVGQGGVVGGNRPRNNSFVMDGLDNNNPSVTGAIATPIQDSVEEFQLLTNQFSAEFGHSTAGQFITTTKSGTNEFHGGIWEYNINRNFMSLDNLTRASADESFEKPRFDNNRFGGQLGGPILKNKLFFYGAYEYQNLTQAASAASAILVPTASGLSTLQSLAGNPATGVSPVNVKLLSDYVPTASTQTDTAMVLNQATGQEVAIGLGPFSGTTPSFNRSHVAQFNTDATLGNRNRLALRLYYWKNGTIAAGALPTQTFNSDPAGKTKRATLSWVWTPTGNVINEFRAGYTKFVYDYPIPSLTAPAGTDVFGNYALDDIGLEIGPNGNYPQDQSLGTLQFANSTTWIKGAHTFKFGGEYREIEDGGGFLPRSRGEYRYESFDQFARDRWPSGLSIRGAGAAGFVADRPAVYAFVQDSWRVTPRVTLDLGVRYEWNGIAQDSAAQNMNAIANVDIRNERDASGQVIFNTLTPAHQALLLSEFPDGAVTFQKPKADTNNFSPRLGFAWDINGDGRSSIRGGFAIAHDVMFGNLPQLQLPPQFQVETTETVACALSPRPAWCALPLDQVQWSRIGFLEGGGIIQVVDPTASTDRDVARASTGSFVPTPEIIPETWTWSLSYQRQLKSDWVVEMRYVGTKGRLLPVQRRKNAGIPNPVALPVYASQQEALSQSYANAPTLAAHLAARTQLLGPYGFAGSMTSFDPVGEAMYHGGSISITRRFANGFGFNVNYTLSRTEDTAENELYTSLLNPRRPDDFWDMESNRGLSALHKAHKLAGTWQWEILRSKHWLLGGWYLNGAVLFESGQALTIQAARDQNGDFDATGDRAWLNSRNDNKLGTDTSFVCYSGGRSFIAGSATACGGDSAVVGYVANDPNARWVRGREGAQRGVGLEKSKRGDFIGPGPIHTLNLGLYKNTNIGGTKLRFGVSCVNCTNTPSYALGTASAINNTVAATSNRAYVTPGTSAFLDETTFSGGLGLAPFQRVVQFEAKLTF
jgi:hypothetical protein